MSIKDELAEELRDSMRSGDAQRRNVIRQVMSEASMAMKEPGFGTDDDSFYITVIQAYSKRMAKAKKEYDGLGDRGAVMSEQLGFEILYLSRWVPEKAGEDETRGMVREAITQLGVDGDQKAMGRVMGQVMKMHADEVDGGLVSRIVREELGIG